MTTTRCPLGVSPRRHRGACVVAPKAGSIPARWPSSGETGARFESACLCAVETISGANSGETKARVVPAIRGTLFNADRLTDSGLKPEMGPVCHTPPDRRPRGLAHSAGQGSTAQPGGRRHFQRSGIRDQTGVLETLPRASNTDEACFKGMGSFRLASQTGEPYTTRPAAPFSISALFHGANSFAYPFPNPSERIGALRNAV